MQSPRSPSSLCWLVLWVLCLNSLASAQFQTRATIRVSGGPISMAVGDFNRDGNADVAEVSYLPTNGVTILLGNGDGTFRTGTSYSMGRQLFSVAAADLRHNGILDLVVGDSLTQYIYVLLGNGDGTFQPPVSYPAIGNTYFVSIGDFNDDGELDIVAVIGSDVVVFPGNGDGTFKTGINTAIPYNVFSQDLVAGDFNHDSKLDLALTGTFGGSNQVDILLGNGDGTFQPDGYYSVFPSPEAIATADFNGDKNLDLVTVNTGGISALLGNGDGTFGPTTGYWSADFPNFLLAADLDGDGEMDVATVSSGNAFPPVQPAGVVFFKGNGDGSFQPGVLFPVTSFGGYVASADFNGDRLPDLVVADFFNESVITLLNTGVVHFSPTTTIKFLFQLINTVSAAQPVTLTNTGVAPLTISSISVQGPFRMGSNCGSQVPAAGHCTIFVAFAPKSKGSKLGTISLVDSASSKPQVIALSGSGTVVSLAPLSLAFPDQKVGTRSAPMTVQMTNQGSSVLNITNISVTGANYQEFAESNNCGSQLAVGARCAIRVTFRPRKTGLRKADVSITDDGGGSPQTVSLSGTGT